MKLLYLIWIFLASCSIFELERPKTPKQGFVIEMQVKDEALFAGVQKLDKLFNYNFKGEKKYKLVLSISNDKVSAGLGSDAFSVSYDVNVTIFYSVQEIKTGKVIIKASIFGIGNYISSREKLLSEYLNEKQVKKEVVEGLAGQIYDDIQRKM